MPRFTKLKSSSEREMATGTDHARSASPEHHHGESLFSKFWNPISNAYKKLVGSFESQIRTGKSAVELPALSLAPLQQHPVMASCTGPLGGLCQLKADLDTATHDPGELVAGVMHWHWPQPQADGDSLTLYEHKANSTQHHGDPIADVYAIVARPNSCILSVADGVNWGIKPRLAARCAVHGALDHLNAKLFECVKTPYTTQDVVHNILRSFHSAQNLIIKHGGTTTTLTVAVIVELSEPKNGCKWGLCCVSVGDTLCYVWRNELQEVHELTSASHLHKQRDPRDCGGCLGADLGEKPDLSNLLCSFVPISEGDIVFVVSDGVSDNFDPVALKEATFDPPKTPNVVPPRNPIPSSTEPGASSNGASLSLPVITTEQRQALLLMKMTKLLREKFHEQKRKLTAMDVKDALTNHVIEVTEVKRDFLEHSWINLENPDLTASERRAHDRTIAQQMKQMPGKLDHATVAAYCVGRMFSEAHVRRKGHSPTHSYVMNSVLQPGSGSAQASKRAGSFATGGSVFYSKPSFVSPSPPPPSSPPLMEVTDEGVM